MVRQFFLLNVVNQIKYKAKRRRIDKGQ